MATGSLKRSGNQSRDVSLSTWAQAREWSALQKAPTVAACHTTFTYLRSRLVRAFMSEWVIFWDETCLESSNLPEQRKCCCPSLRTYSWQPRWRIWHPAWPRRCSLCIRSGPPGSARCRLCPGTRRHPMGLLQEERGGGDGRRLSFNCKRPKETSAVQAQSTFWPLPLFSVGPKMDPPNPGLCCRFSRWQVVQLRHCLFFIKKKTNKTAKIKANSTETMWKRDRKPWNDGQNKGQTAPPVDVDSVCVCVCDGGGHGGVFLCVGIQAFFGACRVDVMQLLLLLGLDVLVLLHSAGVLQVAPVGGQSHQEMDLRKRGSEEERIK